MSDQPETSLNDLSFDRAIPSTPVSVGGNSGVTCANCKRSLTENYSTANGEPICDDCRALLERATAAATEPAVLGKALVFGLGAMLAGAFAYWAMIKIDGREWAIVAIACGWMVGQGMRKGTGGRGGRELQIIGVVLTYLSIALAHLPFEYQEAVARGGGLGAAFIAALLIPVEAIAGGGIRGVLYAIIMFVGLSQAWQQMRRHVVVFEGPFRVGNASS